MADKLVWERRFPVRLEHVGHCFVTLPDGVLIRVDWKLYPEWDDGKRIIVNSLHVRMSHYGTEVCKYATMKDLDFLNGYTDIKMFRGERGWDIPFNTQTLRIAEADQSREYRDPIEPALLKYPAEMVIQLRGA